MLDHICKTIVEKLHETTHYGQGNAWAETYAPFGDIVVVMHDVSGKSKVTDLHYLALGEEDIPGCEVPMHALHKEMSE